MAGQQEHCAEDDFVPFEEDTHHVSRTKRIRYQPPKTDLTRPHRSSRDHPCAFKGGKPSLRPRARSPKAHSKVTSLGKIRRTSLVAAELANLADYNAPPEKSSAEIDSDDDVVPRCRRTWVSIVAQSTRITKPQSRRAATSPIKPSLREPLNDELVQLKPWAHWNSENNDDSTDSDSEDSPEPRSHARHYPPRQSGVQNLPWSNMPAELRNTIYEHCMANEEGEVLSVLHYPHGIPRRSIRGVSTTTNFAHSYWGLTQTCSQLRNEFTPWLLQKRNARTPLATLNNYVNTFHRPDSVTRERIGRVEPICTGAPFPGDGVEPELRVGDYNELNIFRELGQLYEKDLGNHIRKAGLTSINIASVPQKDDKPDDKRWYFYDEESQTKLSDNEEERSHRILVKLKVDTALADPASRDKRILSLSRFVYDSKLANKGGVELHAFFAGGDASWKVRQRKVVDMVWKKKNEGQKVFRRLTAAFYALHGFGDGEEDSE